MGVTALAALAAWPAFADRAAAPYDPVLAATPAPLRDDALVRRETIAFEERRVREDPTDQITPRMLAGQYLQRYRERGDVGDLSRAEAMARRSLALQPRGNVAALTVLAEVQTTYHRFADALHTVARARREAPTEPSLLGQQAALQMEIGDLDAARRSIARIGDGTTRENEVVTARLDELTGDLADARRLLDRAAHRADAIYEVPAERRAWYHVRLGEMAFNDGEPGRAADEERTALARHPANYQAWTDLARFAAARGDLAAERDAAQHAADLRPEPENLGLLADACDGLGDRACGDGARDAIDALRRIGNTQHLWDRYLALYDADHGVALDEAWTIARRELRLRDDPFTEDTLAWVAAKRGDWSVARSAERKASRWHTQDVRMRAHADYITSHAGA